jgi:hypothetical protein
VQTGETGLTPMLVARQWGRLRRMSGAAVIAAAALPAAGRSPETFAEICNSCRGGNLSTG